jgi:LemA protein
MDPLQVVSLVVPAVLFFWGVGAYNRVVDLRNAIVRAYAQIDAQLKRRQELVGELVTALRPVLHNEHGTLDAVLAASAQASAAAAAVRPRPGAAEPVAQLAAAEQVLAGSLARLRALIDLNREPAGAAGVGPVVAELAEIEQQLVFARQLFNAAATGYNDAVHQFPTRLLAPLFRFAPAGRL